MDRTDAVIDAIDGALEDWEVSGDAMRWVPEESRKDSLPDAWRDAGYMTADPLATLVQFRSERLSQHVGHMFDETVWLGMVPTFTILDETHLWIAGRETTRSVEELRARAALAGGRLDEFEWVEPTPESRAETERVLRILHSTDHGSSGGAAEGHQGDDRQPRS